MSTASGSIDTAINDKISLVTLVGLEHIDILLPQPHAS